MARNNRNLNTARNNKSKNRDEFYTFYPDIKREMEAYVEYDQDVFRDKVIYCPCDDPQKSQFVKYFIRNFNRLGIRELIASCIAADGSSQGKFARITSENMFVKNPGMPFSLEAVKYQMLEGNGDFRSEECTRFRDEADIIVTNPPLSLFKEFFDWVMAGKKKFITVCNISCIAYKNIFPYIISGEVHRGARWHKRIPNEKDGGMESMWFEMPVGTAMRGAEQGSVNGRPKVVVGQCGWLTNLPHSCMPKPVDLKPMRENVVNKKFPALNEFGYQLYVNYPGGIIDVPYSKAIPSDFDGVMGVPITFYEDYCPEQFEILGLTNERQDLSGLHKHFYTKAENINYRNLNGTAVVARNGELKPVYVRMLIRKRD